MIFTPSPLFSVPGCCQHFFVPLPRARAAEALGFKRRQRVSVAQCRNMSDAVLAHSLDPYGGANIDAGQLPPEAAEFESRLLLSLHAWQLQGVQGVWLNLPINRSELVPVAVKHGFEYHSAAAESCVLCRWLPPSKSLLPRGPTAQVGVGAYILSSDNKILLVMEACGPAAAAKMWKVVAARATPARTALPAPGSYRPRGARRGCGGSGSAGGARGDGPRRGIRGRTRPPAQASAAIPALCCTLKRLRRGGIAVGGFDDMFVTCACTIAASSHDAPLALQTEELAGPRALYLQWRM